MRDKIRRMTETVKELNKLVGQLVKLFWKICSLVSIILFLIYSVTK